MHVPAIRCISAGRMFPKRNTPADDGLSAPDAPRLYSPSCRQMFWLLSSMDFVLRHSARTATHRLLLQCLTSWLPRVYCSIGVSRLRPICLILIAPYGTQLVVPKVVPWFRSHGSLPTRVTARRS